MTRKILLGFIICFILIAGGITAVFVQGTGNYPGKENINPNRTLINQREEEPAKLIIPKLQIHAHIESVGQDNTGAMAVPAEPENVAWYNLGYRPGETGNAVIAGHLDDVNGDPAVFSRLKDLKVGDEVITMDSGGDRKTFIVTLIESYKANEVPLETVFGEFPVARLNLITCDGVFVNGSYTERTVVYTKLQD